MESADYPAISEEQRGSTLEVRIEYGSRRDELAWAFVQTLVLIPAAIITWPDLKLMALRPDLFEVLRTCLFALAIVLTAAVVIPSISAKAAAVLRFSPSSISYDSGRPPVHYLLKNSGGRFSRYLRMLFAPRVTWTIARNDLPVCHLVSTADGCLTIRGRDCPYQLSQMTPQAFIPRITQLVNAWAARELPLVLEPAAALAPKGTSSLPNPPDGYSYSILGDECHIEHRRTGMACLNLFLGIWLLGWGVGCGVLIYAYLTGNLMEEGGTTRLSTVLGFVAIWFVVAALVLCSLFARKTFLLTKNVLEIRTRLLGVSWTVTEPRNAITRIKQVKDGGEGEDSFPSWGLQLVSTDVGKSPLSFNFGRKTRYRSLLARLPYDHSAWLGKVIAQWAGVEVELCPKPGTEAADLVERPVSAAKPAGGEATGSR